MRTHEEKSTDYGDGLLGMGAKAIQSFVRLESFGGILIMIAAMLAMILANSPLGEDYRDFLNTYLSISFGEIGLKKSLLHWVNDGLMALFFLLVGLEIKRELLEGELSSRDKALLPLIAAIGGMALPALIYSSVNWDNAATMRGWAIPSATDIAFALGVLSLLGSRVPLSLKVFLTAVAVIDDLGAVIIIALFYTANISIVSLAIAILCLTFLVLINLRGVNKLSPFVVLGVVMWLAVMESGVHATIAGVIFGLTIPLRTNLADGTPMLRHVEHGLHSWVAYMILPVFAFANAGVDFSGITAEHLKDTVPLGIALGLFLGKQVGIFTFTSLMILSGLARMPERASWLQLYGVSIMCGIGFTMSLFIGSLAFNSELLMTETRLGVMLGSICSGLLGYSVLAYAARRYKHTEPLENMHALDAKYPKQR